MSFTYFIIIFLNFCSTEENINELNGNFGNKSAKYKKRAFKDEQFNETSYYIENGLRKVYPYYFTFTTFTRGRWVGQKILEVFLKEFDFQPVEVYEKYILSGSVTVNYERVPLDYRLKHDDFISDTFHKHEAPVSAEPITIVHMDEDIVAINKPASIPVHPCGNYRLDRLTSGILILGRTREKTQLIQNHIRERLVKKEYVCRVEGYFPYEEINCNKSIEAFSPKLSVSKVSSNGKESSTVFRLLFYDEVNNSSVVLCLPRTGRSHQIRVHLQYLGYPVINDPMYNNLVFGPKKGKGGNFGGKSEKQLLSDLENICDAKNWLCVDSDMNLSILRSLKIDEDYKNQSLSNKGSSQETQLHDLNDESVQAYKKSSSPGKLLDDVNSKINNTAKDSSGNKVTIATQTNQEDLSYYPNKMSYDKNCYKCKIKYRDPKPENLIMYLHAWRYTGPDWSYETQLPDWAKSNWRKPNK